jgi:hypothetical protein
MDAVNDFKSIRRKLERQEQKAEFEAKSRPVAWTPDGGHISPLVTWRRVNEEPREYAITRGQFGDEFIKLPDGSTLSRPIST